MNIEVLKNVCKNMSMLSGIPMRIYKNNQLVKTFELLSFDFDFANHYKNKLKDTEKTVNMLFSNKMLMYGFVDVESTDFNIIVGPSRSVVIDESAAKDLILQFDLPLDKTKELKEYLNSSKSLSIENFALLIATLSMTINHSIIKINSLIENKSTYDINKSVYRDVLKIDENRGDVYNASLPNMKFEEQMLFFVKRGMTEKLVEHMKKGYVGREPISSINPLRHYKNRCISMITLISRAAMDGGLDPHIAYELFDMYILKIELANDINIINTIQATMMQDFTNRVRAMYYGDTDNPTINRAIRYINQNLQKKLTASDIAKKLNFNPGYLSVKFKKSCGVSMSEYINQQKITEAKRLLKFTDKPLAEISNYLSFSSQSYFQNLFKRFTDMTPGNYRKSPKD